MKSRSAATAPGSGTASGFAASSASPLQRAKPRFRLAAKPSGRSLRIASRSVAHGARHVRDHDQLVDLCLQRRQRLRELLGLPVRDDDGRDLHRESTWR